MTGQNAPRSITVVGAGVAGISVCEGLRRRGYEDEIILVNGEPWAPYDRPALSKRVLVDGVSAKDVALKPETWYEDNSIQLLAGKWVSDIDSTSRRVHLSEGSHISTERVVLTTGARPALLPGITAGGPIKVLRDYDDALELRQAMLPGTRIAIMGAGLIGTEVASAAVALGCEVTLVAPNAPLMEHLGVEFAEALHDQHSYHGVRLIAARVVGLETSGSEARCLLGSGEVLTADVVLLGLGAKPETGLGSAGGVGMNDGFLVDDLGRTTNPFVFAAGDAARRIGRNRVLEPWKGHWDDAVRSAAAVVAGLLGDPAPARGLSWFWSDRYNTHLEVVGELKNATELVTRGEPGASGSAVFGLAGNKCVSAASIDSPNTVRAARRLIERGIPVSSASLSDESQDMRKLLVAH